jgi:hypothetical protein
MQSANIPLWVIVAAALLYPIITTGLSILISNRGADKRAKVQADAAAITAGKVESVRVKLLETDAAVNGKLLAIDTGQKEIHNLVNSRLTAALDYISKLEVLLRNVTGRPMEGEPEAMVRSQTAEKK